MADNDLLITISADAKNAIKAFDDVRKKTEDLEEILDKTAKVSAVGFAALTAEIGFSVHAFAEAEAASRELTQALQVQGLAANKVSIETADGTEKVVGITEAYKEYAEEVQNLTGIDDDAITKAQAVAQGYLGQTKITKDLTQAIADLSTKYGGDLNAAAEAIGRTIGTQTNAFARQGLVISDTATKAERMATVLEFVQGRFNGQAEAANQGLGSIKGLTTAFGNLQEAIGQRFAPVVTFAFQELTKLFNFISGSPQLTNLAVSFLAAGTAITALGIALPLLAKGFIVVKAALDAAKISMTGTQIAVRGLIGATGIGLLVIAATELALNWDKIFPRLQAVAVGFANAAGAAFKGLSEIVSGLAVLDFDRVEQGFTRLKNGITEGYKEAVKEIPEATKEVVTQQDEVLAAAAAKRTARETAEAARRAELRKSEDELIQLQLQNASETTIELKRQEIAILKQLETEKNATTIELLQERREQILALEAEQREEDLERKQAYAEEDAAIDAEIAQVGIDAKEVLRQQDRASLENSLLTEKETERKIALEIAQERVKNRNIELEDRKKYGIAVSTINAALRSDEIQGAKAVSGELVALAQSKNATLKAIGKAAAIAQITIATATSAVTIAQQVIQALPFPINLPIAVALSAARVAYGVEQIGNVQAAAEGGLVTGGIPGRDSVPILAQPGELIVPTALTPSFLDVIGGGGQAPAQAAASPNTDALLGAILERLTGEYGLKITGDMFGSDVIIDGIIQKISDRIEFGNATIVGVNA